MSAERAARQILQACRRGSARLVLGMHTKAAIAMNELFPGVTSPLLAAGNQLLPRATAQLSATTYSGLESQSKVAPSWLTHLSNQAALRNNQFGKPT